MTFMRRIAWALLGAASAAASAAAGGAAPAAPLSVEPLRLAGGAAPPLSPLPGKPLLLLGCLQSGDGYLRAKLGGAIETKIDWPNSGTRCEGNIREQPPGIRVSFQRIAGASPDLLFVFGIAGVREGRPAREAAVNVTVIVQGSSRIYGTQGDKRCTVDSLTQTPLPEKGLYRVEARGFCTQPAHAVRGKDALLVSTFEFAAPVSFTVPKDDAHPFVVPAISQ